MKKKQYKKALKECNNKLNYANKTVAELMQEVEFALRKNAITENHMQIAERELQAKECIILELKTWIGDLHRREVM